MTVQYLPLSKLVSSPDNVRKTDRLSGIEQLAASIEAHGLLQNLQAKPASKLADPYRRRKKVRVPAANLQLVADKRPGQVARNSSCGKEPIILGQTRRWMAVRNRPKRAGADCTNDQDYHQPHKGGPV